MKKRIAKKAHVKRAARTKTVRLSRPADLKRLTRPPSNFEEWMRRAAETWTRLRKHIRVPGLTPKRLLRLLDVSERAQKVEQRVREAAAVKVRAVQEKRMRAQDAAWRALLDLRAFAETTARRLPHVGTAFQFLADALSRKGPGEQPPDAPAPPAGGGGAAS